MEILDLPSNRTKLFASNLRHVYRPRFSGQSELAIVKPPTQVQDVVEPEPGIESRGARRRCGRPDLRGASSEPLTEKIALESYDGKVR